MRNYLCIISNHRIFGPPDLNNHPCLSFQIHDFLLAKACTHIHICSVIREIWGKNDCCLQAEQQQCPQLGTQQKQSFLCLKEINWDTTAWMYALRSHRILAWKKLARSYRQQHPCTALAETCVQGRRIKQHNLNVYVLACMAMNGILQEHIKITFSV